MRSDRAIETSGLWSVDETAQYLGISTTTVRRMLASGRLTARKVGGQWRFDPDRVKADRQREDGTFVAPTQLREPTAIAISPSWASGLLNRWRRWVLEQLALHRPDHVIVTDRRGSKIWEMFGIGSYVWGENLWHSAAVKLMSSGERRRLFRRRKVLIFDEILQRGRDLARLRMQLQEQEQASVVTVVCVRKRSIAERGALAEQNVIACEDLDDGEFSRRAAIVSKLTSTFRPPLDVDHLVVRAALDRELDVSAFLERLSRWGVPFVIWRPEAVRASDGNHQPVESGTTTLAISLDRPQFFESNALPGFEDFETTWDGPCKVRFYIEPGTRTCHCSFIAYPTVNATMKQWRDVAYSNELELPLGVARPRERLNDEFTVRRVYANICMEYAWRLLRDFIDSGAADDVGIRFDHSAEFLDDGQFSATFGPGFGGRVLDRTRELLQRVALSSERSLSNPATAPIQLFVRPALDETQLSHDVFTCRSELLGMIPRQHTDHDARADARKCLAFADVLAKLPAFSQATIGCVVDYEIDRGTVKPFVDLHVHEPSERATVTRGLVRGEFGPYYEWEGDEPTHEDALIQQSLGLGPSVVQEFAKAIKKPALTGTQFAKLFANLQHDWKDRLGPLFLGWRPYKYGPLPIVPISGAAGELTRYETFLERNRCLTTKREQHGSQVWVRYGVPDDSPVPWSALYRRRTDASQRAHISSLVQVYARVQDLKLPRARTPRSEDTSTLGDSLVVLGAARNQEVAYRCAWFEVHDWKTKGRMLFPLIEAIAQTEDATRAPGAILRAQLSEFAEPARLLHEKIEMYRNLPVLREQIEALQADLPFAEVVLETVDKTPVFDTTSVYPMATLEWASRVMRSFSSFARQILTKSGLDIDTRDARAKVDDGGVPIDATYVLKELLQECSELGTLRSALELCITDADTGTLTPRTAEILTRGFRVITEILEVPGRVPDPRPEYESRRERNERTDGLILRLREVAIPEPYVIAVADIRNLVHLCSVGELLGVSYEDAMSKFLKWVAHAGREAKRGFPNVKTCGPCADNLILVGPNPDEVVRATVFLIRETTRRLAAIDGNQLAHLGLLRAGIALNHSAHGEPFSAVKPGLIAHGIGDRSGRSLGAVVVTEAVFNLLSSEVKQDFRLSEEKTEQGVVWLREWSHERDGR